MKNRKQTILLCTIALFVAAILVGWKIKPVELLDNKPLIDLNSAIQEPSWGKEGSTDNNLDETPQEENISEISDSEAANTVQPVAEEKEYLVVTIHGEEILLNGGIVKDIQVLRDRLLQQYSENMIVSLEDDYAEAHLYKEVRDMLKQLEQEVDSFKYDESPR